MDFADGFVQAETNKREGGFRMRQASADAPSIATEGDPAINTIAARQRRVALAMTAAVTVLYLGFLVLVAYAKPALGTITVDGWSVGLILGPLVVIGAWVLCCIYVGWANRIHDADCRRMAGRPR